MMRDVIFTALRPKFVASSGGRSELTKPSKTNS
jgi:hypothetical protein